MRAERRLAIMQPYFFPYLGYFQLMAEVDAFVVFDDVNFINRGWINRNRININGAPYLITVPLKQASQNKLICEISVDDHLSWRDKLLKTIGQAYSRAPQFARVFPLVESIVRHPAGNLADYLRHSLLNLRDFLGLGTEIISTSRRYENSNLTAQSRIIDICLRERADIYINAIGGKELYEHTAFESAGVKLRFLQPALPPYGQSGAEFMPGLSMIDVLMHNDGQAVTNMLKSGRCHD
ncbi:WbqC family protein [Paraburkholderia sp. DGU8]|uniref:WbqC family protein n=1 Tax=Paraburkholderia sp. DGU8 TaxID=3161997 RepID=UPI0034653899